MGRKLIAVFILLAGMAAAPMAVGYGVYRGIQKQLGVKLEGRYAPVFLQPAFYVRNVRFEWKDRVRLISGDLRVDYRPWSLLPHRPLEIRLRGTGLQIELLGDWAELQGAHEVSLDRFRADLGLGPDGIEEIYFLDAYSPVFQFHVEKTDLSMND